MLNLDADISKSEWREYAPGLRFLLRPITRTEFRKMRKEAAQRIKGRGQQADALREQELDKGIYRHVIEDWEGVVGNDEKKKPCTAEHIDALCDKLPKIAAWIIEEAESLAEETALIEGTEIKN